MKKKYENSSKNVDKYNNFQVDVLKNFTKNTKGFSIRYKITTFFDYLKYAWQRAWRGYDDISIWNYDIAFFNYTQAILIEMYKRNVGCWRKPEDKLNNKTIDANNFDSAFYTFEETQEVLRKMIMLLDVINTEDQDPKVKFDAFNYFMKHFNEHLFDLWI